MSYTVPPEVQPGLQTCPKCGKQSLAQPRENHYRCVWCGFESDVSNESFHFPQFIFLIALVACVVILLQGG